MMLMLQKLKLVLMIYIQINQKLLLKIMAKE
jgi:hypothetical protein